ncbi:response regulator receiver domain [Citrobacter sp. Cpo142]|nr:response regulator receiver domain [Citrobacter sp. Cpo142]MDM2776675.1 response regulator receiver domain [Citrobacter sp. Cpo142]
MKTFNEFSATITDHFIQNIIFIDDKAYNQNGPKDQHEFDAQEVTKIFSKKGKICAVYKPQLVSDLEYLTSIATKSDVTILDWQIVLDEEFSDNDSQNDEDDAEEDDVRGVYTKKIITSLLANIDNQHCIKLILIYTGEVDLPKIASEVDAVLTEKNISGFKINENDPCTVMSNNCKIMVISKSNGGEGRAQHLPQLADKTKTYDELPDFISLQFTEMTSGLLSNFAMESLAEIRKNFHHILTLFSKELDAAYLAHQTLLPNTYDANELLVQLLSDTFSSIIRYKNLNQFLNEDKIKLWLGHNIEGGVKPLYKSDGTPENVFYQRNPDVLLQLLQSNSDVKDKFCNSLVSSDGQQLSSKKIDILINKYATTLFTEFEKTEEINKTFAKLCYHRSAIFSPHHLPFLTLGTVVKSTLDNGSYYICIQQRCDSVRIQNGEIRRFLFISLEKVNDGGFNFLTPDGIKLKIDKSTYSLRTVKFSGNNGFALATKCETNNKKYFEPSYYSKEHPEKFEFIVELKELYAQRIVEEYSSSLSRVGLDEPEWVRRLN